MLKIIFIVFLVIAFVPPVRKFLFWLVVGRSMVNEQKKYNQQSQKQNRKDGDINVDYVPKNAKGHDYRGGEYVDYEEVED
ncbi:hypothetical protein [Jiulongibacter sediminis]|uniref:DUF4834 domain-containing protein n=1 Tax=Jiulongibacter sediminis TaxID=1605367 RepID=A0A0P7C3I9_9BACT|nr:hypothetical protein [Jiulongibacter sediminis]KPM49201.1 hypothetical protein AFM12_00715 [Jiulongibacter sediminis]TBX26256.1 hypothetical protein TK44_00715 [Jiulongibacter sediminis]